jgi:hypothetical protein
VAPVASALEYRHGRGLRHGAVCPSNIVFVGSAAKLAVDTLSVSDDAGRDADLHQLGTTITEVMTGQTTGDAANELPPVLREIAIGCWSGSDRQWTASRIARVASGQLGAATPESAAPLALQQPPSQSIVDRLRRRWPVLALAGAILVALLFMLRRDTPPNATVTPAPQQAVPPPAVTPVIEPERSARKDRDKAWAVVAAAYSDFEAARKRAHKFPRALRAHVYPAQPNGNRYYVVLGSGLSADAARKLRVRAIRMGAPRDTYVTLLSGD